MLAYWIWFSRIPEQFRKEKLELLSRFHDPEEIYYTDGRGFPELPEKLTEYLSEKDLQYAHGVLDQCSRKGISLLTYGDGNYPSALKNIPDPPMVLYYKGTLPDWESVPAIGIVGTRKASAYGLQTAKRLGSEIAAGGGLLVSGGAGGIDSAAMLGGVMQGRPVVAVLGNGVDIVYPASNRELFAQVVKCGCLLSEYPPGTGPARWKFPQRNRIISGISDGVLVVEAPKKSGALITARYAWEQGREVFTVPGNVDNPNCEGSNALLRDRAIPVSGGWDVLREYENLYPGKLHPVDKRAEMQAEVVSEKPSKPSVPDKKNIDKEEKSKYIDWDRVIGGMTEQERTVWELLTDEPQNMDDLIAGSGLSAAAVLGIITRLSVRGIVKNHPGNRISRYQE